MRQGVPFHVPDIGEEEIESVVATLRSGWLTTGAKVHQFEQEFAAIVGASHAVAVNSCTAALHLALEAIGVTDGDEVIVPTMTFAATAEVVAYFNAKPVLVDCRPDTLTIDPSRVEEAITDRTRAIIPVHFAGHPCDMAVLLRIAQCRGIRVIEDAAHAFPALYRGRMVGAIGDLTCFSFYATKNMTTGEGGMVTTNNGDWASRVRMMSLHGLSRDAWTRYTERGSWAYDILSPGFKYNLTDIAAALGLPQLAKAKQAWKSRERYAALYRDGFRDVPEVILPTVETGVEHAWHLYVIQIKVEDLRINRNQFIERLKQMGISSSVHFIPLHLHPYYRDAWGYRPSDFPVATRAFERTISLPLYSKMTEDDVQRVIQAVKDVIRAERL